MKWLKESFRQNGVCLKLQEYTNYSKHRFFKIFGRHKSFCGATDTPVLDFWWHMPWVSKPGWIPLLACFIAYIQWISQIHLWCDTCWPLGSQPSSQAVSSTYLYLHTSIGRTWVQDQACHCLTAYGKTDVLPTKSIDIKIRGHWFFLI